MTEQHNRLVPLYLLICKYAATPIAPGFTVASMKLELCLAVGTVYKRKLLYAIICSGHNWLVVCHCCLTQWHSSAQKPTVCHMMT